MYCAPKSKKKESTFGWDQFNDNSLYRAYTKRTAKINTQQIESMTEDEKIARMADEIEEQIEKRGQFSRRRTFVDEKNIDYINERNRKFNEKLERNYKRFAQEIKDNLERGTAL